MDADGAFVPTKVNCPADKNSTEYDNMLGKLTQEQWNNRGDKKYYSYGEAKGMWKLVLYRMDGDTKTEKAYTLNNFNNMVGSCEQTVYKSTINELKEAGIITVEDATKFQKPIRVVTGTAPDLQVGYIKILSDGSIGSTPNEGEATLMGELTLEQFINAIIQYSV